MSQTMERIERTNPYQAGRRLANEILPDRSLLPKHDTAGSVAFIRTQDPPSSITLSWNRL